MKTLFYTEEQVKQATVGLGRLIPSDFLVAKLPRTEDGLIVGGTVDPKAQIHEDAVILGSTITGETTIDEGAVIVGSVVDKSKISPNSITVSSELVDAITQTGVKVANSWVNASTIDRLVWVDDSVVSGSLVVGQKSRISRSFVDRCTLNQVHLVQSLAVQSDVISLDVSDDRVFSFTSCVIFNSRTSGLTPDTKHLTSVHGALITPQTPVRAAEVDGDSALTFFNKLNGAATIDTSNARLFLPLHATAEVIGLNKIFNWGPNHIQQQAELIDEATQGLGREIPDKLIHIKGVDTAINLLEEMEANFK